MQAGLFAISKIIIKDKDKNMRKYLFSVSLIVGLLVFAGYSLAQTNTGVSATTNMPSVTKCGVNTFSVTNECGMGAFKNAYFQCYDGYEEKQGGDSSCKSSETWQEYGKTACANHCNNAKVPVAAPAEPVPTVKAPESTATPVCNIGGDLTKQYNTLILELQKEESASNEARAKEITDQIIALKQQIAASKNECQTGGGFGAVSGSIPPTVMVPQPTAPTVVNRCGEVNQWQEKINYYQKLYNLSDDDLAKETSFSKEEIKNTLSELQTGIEKVKNQCNIQSQGGQGTTMSQAVKPVAAGSGQEIDVYYKAEIEKITAPGTAVQDQIQKLKALRGEIDGLIEKLIQGRKEVEIGELDNLVNEVKVSAGEIKADDVAIKTTEKKILINVGDTAISIEPTQNNVLIKDNGLEVNTGGVSIKENVLSVGDAEVKMAASDVAQKLNVSPSSVELKAENQQAVYEMKTAENRKLFGFIKINMQKTITADAQNGNLLKEQSPWYAVLTTK